MLFIYSALFCSFCVHFVSWIVSAWRAPFASCVLASCLIFSMHSVFIVLFMWMHCLFRNQFCVLIRVSKSVWHITSMVNPSNLCHFWVMVKHFILYLCVLVTYLFCICSCCQLDSFFVILCIITVPTACALLCKPF